MYKYLIFLPTILAVGPLGGTYKGSKELSVMKGFTAIVDMEVNFVPTTEEAKMKFAVSRKPLMYGKPNVLYKFDSEKLSEPPKYTYNRETKVLTLQGKEWDTKLKNKGIDLKTISVDEEKNKINLEVGIDYQNKKQKRISFKDSITLQLNYQHLGEDSDEDSGNESGGSGSSSLLRQKSTSQLPLSKDMI